MLGLQCSASPQPPPSQRQPPALFLFPTPSPTHPTQKHTHVCAHVCTTHTPLTSGCLPPTAVTCRHYSCTGNPPLGGPSLLRQPLPPGEDVVRFYAWSGLRQHAQAVAVIQQMTPGGVTIPDSQDDGGHGPSNNVSSAPLPVLLPLPYLLPPVRYGPEDKPWSSHTPALLSGLDVHGLTAADALGWYPQQQQQPQHAHGVSEDRGHPNTPCYIHLGTPSP